MKKTLFVYLIAIVIAIFAFDGRNVSASDSKTATAQTEEYISIIYGGRYESYILRPGGKADFQNLGSVNFPERTQEQSYLMHLLVEKCSKEGFTIVDYVTSGHVVMKRKVSK